MRLCSYTVVHDTGFAPNPFHRYCTLATCTPNHMGVRLSLGGWILGTSSVNEGNKLIYAMKVSEILDLDDYFNDPRFERKKPGPGGWKRRCGDNIYFRRADGKWAQSGAYFHTEP